MSLNEEERRCLVPRGKNILKEKLVLCGRLRVILKQTLNPKPQTKKNENENEGASITKKKKTYKPEGVRTKAIKMSKTYTQK